MAFVAGQQTSRIIRSALCETELGQRPERVRSDARLGIMCEAERLFELTLGVGPAPGGEEDRAVLCSTRRVEVGEP